MSEELKISIIVPIYNVEKYLHKCIQSLITQTHRNLEIILVDDGSTDSSGQICDEYALIDDRIIVLHQKNAGAAAARNAGIMCATAEYVHFMDSDDWLEVNTFKIVAEKILQSKVDIVRFNYIREYEGLSLPKRNVLLEQKIYKDEEYCKLFRQSLGLIDEELKHIESFNFFSTACCGCYRREIIINNNLQFLDVNALGTFEDGLFNIEFLSKAKTCLYVDEYLYHYRKDNSASCINKAKKEFLKKNMYRFEKIDEAIQPQVRGKDFVAAYFNRIAYCVLELNLNVMKNNDAKFKARYKEIKTILKEPLIKMALKKVKLKYLPLKWKMYYFLLKMRWALGVYIITKAIYKLKGRK